MAYTERVAVSGTALSFLLYECINSHNGQEGFLIGDITSEITNHISDSQSDQARLDTQIIIKTVLPLPCVSLFYCPTGRIKEDVVSELLSGSANDVVGWYKYRKNSNIKPTFRDKLISKGLQKYFERHHGNKSFVSCNLSNKVSVCSSTHTFTYRFGKINCFDMYEYVEDITGNLGEKVTAYKKPHRYSPHSIFNKIIKESNVQNGNTSEAILCIQETVNNSLRCEAKQASKHENVIRELEAEIKEMSAILSDRHVGELQASYDELVQNEKVHSGIEMVNACVEALESKANSNHVSYDGVVATNNCSSIGVNVETKPVMNYASALKATNSGSHSAPNNCEDDLISFDVDEAVIKKSVTVNEDAKCTGSTSPKL